MPPKKPDTKLPPSEELKEGGLRKMLKLKKDEKFMIGELSKVKKTKAGEMFDFRGKQYKMTPLMQKRVDLALTFLRLPKKKAAGEFAKKNKGKAKPKNPIDGDLLDSAIELVNHNIREEGGHEHGLGIIPTHSFDTKAQAQSFINSQFQGNGLIFEESAGPGANWNAIGALLNDNQTNKFTPAIRTRILQAAQRIGQEDEERRRAARRARDNNNNNNN